MYGRWIIYIGRAPISTRTTINLKGPNNYNWPRITKTVSSSVKYTWNCSHYSHELWQDWLLYSVFQPFRWCKGSRSTGFNILREFNTFKYSKCATIKIHQGCFQPHILVSITLLHVRYNYIFLGKYHPHHHEWSPQITKYSKISLGRILRHSKDSQFCSKTNSHQKSNIMPQHIVILEGNPIKKLEKPHWQVKGRGNIQYSKRTTSIIVHIPTLVFRPQVCPP